MWRNIDISNKQEEHLIKFVSEEHLFDFLETGDIWFSRADKFGDKMECVTIDDLNETPFPFDELRSRKHKRLISCWHNANEESISMWDASYGSIEKKRVYAIKFQHPKLLDYIVKSEITHGACDMVYGSVKYQNLIDQVSNTVNRIEISAFRKENAFNYEKEYRFVLLMAEPFPKNGLNVKIGNPDDLEFTIMINPLLGKRSFNYFEGILNQHRLGRKNLSHSKLVDFLKPTQW